jgi:hypothetical protein
MFFCTCQSCAVDFSDQDILPVLIFQSPLRILTTDCGGMSPRMDATSPRVPPFPRSSEASVWRKRCGWACFTPACSKTAAIVLQAPFPRLRSLAASLEKKSSVISRRAFGLRQHFQRLSTVEGVMTPPPPSVARRACPAFRPRSRCPRVFRRQVLRVSR